MLSDALRRRGIFADWGDLPFIVPSVASDGGRGQLARERPAPVTRRRNAGDSRGSSVSRMPSPRRLKASTVTVMARPGKNASHQGGTRAVIESASMLPQVGVGGGTPT